MDNTAELNENVYILMIGTENYEIVKRWKKQAYLHFQREQ